jgi:flagella synthesis protein FlgN
MAIASPGATLADERHVIGSIVELMKTEQQFLISADADGLAGIVPNKLQLAHTQGALNALRPQTGAAGVYGPGGQTVAAGPSRRYVVG